MTYLTRPFFDFLFAVAPYGLPLLVIDLLALYLMIFKERFEPRTLIFWVAIVIVVPFLGFALYMVFGNTLFAGRTFGRKSADDRRFMDADGHGEGPEDAKVMRSAGADVCTGGNSVRLYWNRDWMEPDALEDLESAERSIHLMFRRMPHDSDPLVPILIRKASEGIDVRLMTSSLGFGRTRGVRELKRAGVRFCTFHNPLYSLLSVRPAYRNMRSLVVVDDRVAYQGRGAISRVEGPAAARLELRFRADWLHGSGEDMGTEVRVQHGEGGGEWAQVVSAGPDCDGSPMASCYTEIVTGARRILRISMPYLMPNDEIYSAIKLAVLSGVEVIMLLPRRGRHWYQSWNSLAASNPLMMAGVRVYFADKSLSKCTLSADGRVCCIGSGNYCGRALRNDFNTGVVVHSEDVAGAMDGCFDRELEDAVECLPEEYVRRSFADRVRIVVARFLMFLN